MLILQNFKKCDFLLFYLNIYHKKMNYRPLRIIYLKKIMQAYKKPEHKH